MERFATLGFKKRVTGHFK